MSCSFRKDNTKQESLDFFGLQVRDTKKVRGHGHLRKTKDYTSILKYYIILKSKFYVRIKSFMQWIPLKVTWDFSLSSLYDKIYLYIRPYIE